MTARTPIAILSNFGGPDWGISKWSESAGRAERAAIWINVAMDFYDLLRRWQMLLTMCRFVYYFLYLQRGSSTRFLWRATSLHEPISQFICLHSYAKFFEGRLASTLQDTCVIILLSFLLYIVEVTTFV